MSSLRCNIRNTKQNEWVDLRTGVPLELGRAVTPAEGIDALRILDNWCSRRQVRLTLRPDSRVLVENTSERVPIKTAGANPLAIGVGEERLLEYPIQLNVGESEILIGGTAATPPPAELSGCQSLMRPVSSEPSLPTADSPGTDELLQWFEALIDVQRAAAGSDEFYEETANALVDLVGLDQGMVLLYEREQWHVKAVDRGSRGQAEFSQTLLNHILTHPETFYGSPSDVFTAASLTHVTTVVASPILGGRRDAPGEVIGVVYGTRMTPAGEVLRESAESPGAGISTLQARLASLLAASVGTGLARAQKETETARLRNQFTDFCSKEVVAELERNTRLLDADQREVSVLFCDMRGFTGLSEQRGPVATHDLMSLIMDTLADCVLQNEGVVIDFYGDGLAAMWNAPRPQPAHADRAVSCAQAILTEVAGLADRSSVDQDMTIRVGVGVHSGPALVGNIGGKRRIKYGPRGPTVNLTSRLEQLTKTLGVDAVLTRETHDQLAAADVFTRPIGAYQVAGTNQPVALFQLFGAGHELPSDALEQFDAALTCFQSGQLQKAAEVLAKPGATGVHDPVADYLGNEIHRRLKRPDEDWPGHIVLHHK